MAVPPVHTVLQGVHVFLFFGWSRCTSCVWPNTARTTPSLRARRADAPPPEPTPLASHTPELVALPPVCLGHLGRTADVVSGVRVRSCQRCSETPPGGAAPEAHPGFQRPREEEATRRCLPMARTGFGPLAAPGASRYHVTSPFIVSKKVRHPLSKSTTPDWMDLGCCPTACCVQYQTRLQLSTRTSQYHHLMSSKPPKNVAVSLHHMELQLAEQRRPVLLPRRTKRKCIKGKSVEGYT